MRSDSNSSHPHPPSPTSPFFNPKTRTNSVSHITQNVEDVVLDVEFDIPNTSPLSLSLSHTHTSSLSLSPSSQSDILSTSLPFSPSLSLSHSSPSKEEHQPQHTPHYTIEEDESLKKDCLSLSLPTSTSVPTSLSLSPSHSPSSSSKKCVGRRHTDPGKKALKLLGVEKREHLNLSKAFRVLGTSFDC